MDGRVATPGTTEVTVIQLNASGVTLAQGATVPTDAEVGYAKGCIFVDTNASPGAVILVNEGGETSCDFNTASLPTGDISSVVAGLGLDGGGTSGAVTLNVDASHNVLYAGKVTWTGSGATKALTVTGVAATDIVIATIQTKPTQAAYLVGVVPSTNTVTFELSAANTSNDAVIAYAVHRAVA